MNILLNVDRNYIIPTKNEMIDENNTYYLIIPINLSHNCSLGQYYDSSKGELKNCFHLFYKEISLLVDYYHINYEALRKIVKKQKKINVLQI